MLEKDLKIQAGGSSCSTFSASKTLEAACTSTGNLIQVSLRRSELLGFDLLVNGPNGLLGLILRSDGGAQPNYGWRAPVTLRYKKERRGAGARMMKFAAATFPTYSS
jgi:hypothetical protein